MVLYKQRQAKYIQGEKEQHIKTAEYICRYVLYVGFYGICHISWSMEIAVRFTFMTQSSQL